MHKILEVFKSIKTKKEIELENGDKAVWIPKEELSAAQIEEFSDFEEGQNRIRIGSDRKTCILYNISRVKEELESEAKVVTDLKKTRSELSKTKHQVNVLTERLEEAENLQSAIEIAAKAVVNRPPAPALNIRAEKNSKNGLYSGKLAGTAILSLSDLHFEEFVSPREIRFYNEYDINIAQKRLDTVMESSANLLLSHSGGTYHDRFILLLNGDLVSGEIHEELTRTNSASLQETIFILAQRIFDNLRQYSQNFRAIEVICTPGNHGRMDHKWSAKGASERSWDMMVCQILKKMVEADQKMTNVQVHLAAGADFVFDVYGTRCLVEHGNSIKTTGDAIAGFITSAVRRKLKLHERESNLGRMRGDPTRGVDYMFIGHFHTLEVFRGVIANGSLIGTNEYAMQGAFRPEPPQQVLVNIHPDYGLNQIWAVQATEGKAIERASAFSIPGQNSD